MLACKTIQPPATKWGKTNIRMVRQQLPRPTVHKTPTGTAGETSAKTRKQGMLPWCRPSLKQSQGRWQGRMCTTSLFSMRRVQQPFTPALKYLQEQMVLRLWTPLIGQRANLSTRDGNCSQKRLDSPLMPWREILRKPRFLTSIIGSMEREWDKLSHGKQEDPHQPVSI